MADLHHDSLVILAYVNPFLRTLADGRLDCTMFLQETPHVQGSVPRYRRGGVDGVFLSFGINDPELFPGRGLIGRLVEQLGCLRRALRQVPEVTIVTSAAELDAARQAGQLAIYLHLTGAPLERSLDALHAYYQLGVRSIHCPFDNRDNPGFNAWQTGEGLTPFGREVIREMNALGMLIDLAHASDRMVFEILDLAARPVMISHTLCRAVTPNGRNAPDEVLKAVAAGGGVIGIHFAGQLIDQGYEDAIVASGFRPAVKAWEAELRREFPDPFAYCAARYDYERWMQSDAYRLQQSVPPPPMRKILDHLDHLIELVGVDHIGLGTDYDLGNIPVDLDRADKLPNLTAAMVAHGYRAEAIRKVLGENFRRIMP